MRFSYPKDVTVASNDFFFCISVCFTKCLVDEDYIIFKKVELPSLQKEFEKIVKVTAKISKEAGITEDVVMKEIKAYRKKKRAS